MKKLPQHIFDIAEFWQAQILAKTYRTWIWKTSRVPQNPDAPIAPYNLVMLKGKQLLEQLETYCETKGWPNV